MYNKTLLTEDDVYKANYKLVYGVCKQFGKILEPEDREAFANIGMLYAIRTYRRGVSDFSGYAASCIQDILQLAEEYQRKVKRVEHPLSLNMCIKSSEGSTTYIEIIEHPKQDCLSSMIAVDFLNKLEKKLRIIACLYINDFTTEEIAERMHVPITKVEQMRNLLCCKWEEYDRE